MQKACQTGRRWLTSIEDRQHQAESRLARARERLTASTLVDANLEAVRYDLDRVSNTFDPGTTDPMFEHTVIEVERARWLRQRLRVLIFDPVLPYIDKLNQNDAKEYALIALITARIQE